MFRPESCCGRSDWRAGGWCRPWGSAADAGLSLCLCLTPACLLFLDGDGQTPRPGWSALAAAVLPGVAALLCSACLSPAWTAQLPQPLYTLTKSLSVLSVMQRFELLLSTAQLLGLVSLLTLLVAVLAGLVIFPAVFSAGLEPTEGASLIFVTLPEIFKGMPFAALWSAVFFILLTLASLTSTISFHEVLTAYFAEEHKLSRKNATLSLIHI